MKQLFIYLLLSTFAFAQNANRKYESYKKTNNTLEIKTSDGLYVLKPYSEKIVETSFIPKGETFNTDSHAVVLIPQKGISKVKETKNTLPKISK